MKRCFENSVLFELRNYKGFIFNPMQLYDLLYNENSEYRTDYLLNIIPREDFLVFAKKLKSFGNGNFLEAFENIAIVKDRRSQDLKDLGTLFAAIIDDFKRVYSEPIDYYSYCYAVLIISIIMATPGYFSDVLLYNFMYFCRKNAILNI